MYTCVWLVYVLAVLPSVAPTGFDVLTQLLGKFIKHVKHEQRSRDSGRGQQIKHNQRIRKLREREREDFLLPKSWVCWENNNPAPAKADVASNWLLKKTKSV